MIAKERRRKRSNGAKRNLGTDDVVRKDWTS